MKYSHISPFSYGLNHLVVDSLNPELMGLNFAIAKVNTDHAVVLDAEQEKLVVLLSGSVTYDWDGQKITVKRSDPFHESPTALHLNSKSVCTVEGGEEDAELIVVSTENAAHFASKFYSSEDLASEELVGEEVLDGKTKRIKRVFFHRNTCQETNLFCGELVNYPGCWACFPPHLHSEPEIYYYRFLPESGYGFSEQGDEVFKVTHNDLVGIEDGKTHSQVTAPGYAGFIFWAQKLQDNGKNIDYHLVEEHAWLDDPAATFFPEKPSI